MSAPHPTATDTADPARLRIFRSPAPDLDEIADRYRANAARSIPITETKSELPDPPVQPPAAKGEARRDGPMTGKPPVGPSPTDRLAEIATLIRTINYGDFIEMAEGIGADPDALWKWAKK